MNLTKKSKIILGAISGVLAVTVIVATILLTGGEMPSPPTFESEIEKTTSNIVVNLPTDNPSETENSDSTSKEKEDALVIDVSGNPENPSKAEDNKKDDNTAKTPAKPVETKKPEQPTSHNDSGIVIEGETPDEEQKAIAQAWLRNLELEGCPYCKSHSCPSFYAKDEWGNPSLDVILCPEYDEKKDPIKYCQNCEKRTGDGSNNTCVSFVNDCNCPNCDRFVKSNTCHTCDK